MGITDLPEDMCDARVYPAMHPLIQAACQNFPKSADAIISHHGLDTDEFNSLQAKVENDFFFRMRVRRGVSLIDREIKGKK